MCCSHSRSRSRSSALVSPRPTSSFRLRPTAWGSLQGRAASASMAPRGGACTRLTRVVRGASTSCAKLTATSVTRSPSAPSATDTWDAPRTAANSPTRRRIAAGARASSTRTNPTLHAPRRPLRRLSQHLRRPLRRLSLLPRNLPRGRAGAPSRTQRPPPHRARGCSRRSRCSQASAAARSTPGLVEVRVEAREVIAEALAELLLDGLDHRGLDAR